MSDSFFGVEPAPSQTPSGHDAPYTKFVVELRNDGEEIRDDQVTASTEGSLLACLSFLKNNYKRGMRWRVYRILTTNITNEVKLMLPELEIQ